MAKERRDQPVLWDEVVSGSIKRLSNAPKNAERLSVLPLSAQAITRHQLTLIREPGKIDPRIRSVIRKASVDGIKWPLVLCGNPGIGKTFAGLCVCDHCHNSEWWSWDEFWRLVNDINMRRAKGRHLPGKINPEGYRELSQTITWTPSGFWAWFARLPLAVIDDVGLRGDANDTQYEALKNALDHREGKPLILTTNKTVLDLGKEFDLRVMDRAESGTVIELFGDKDKSMR